MKKLDKKLRLHRDTVIRLDSQVLGRNDLAKVKGGIDWTGCDSACTECTQQVALD
ncbi:MAG TPA: hypothetical protein VKK31_04895 [Thermoanaerobaculia bacterium]|nr:hypothetical protein [Thermoanaerobaculia bacterium]